MNDILDNSELNIKYIIKNFPIYCGCTNDSSINDIQFDIQFGISKSTGIIQICNYPSDDIIYICGSHNNAIGKIWDSLFNKLTNIINDLSLSNINICEIGSSHAKLLNKLYNVKLNISTYTIYEPNPSQELVDADIKYDNVNLIKEYFNINSNSVIEKKFDIILHSHLLEHLTNPCDFFHKISKLMNSNTVHIFALPNLLAQFKKYYSNALFLEHKFLLSEDYIDILLYNNNFTIIGKEYYLEDHSIIYITKLNINNIKKKFPNNYILYNSLLDDYFIYYKSYIKLCNNTLANYNNPIYLYGAHVWTHNLICLGLNIEKIEIVLDNDIKKHNMRLYGTKLITKSPSIITNIKCLIILNVSAYRQEIADQLYILNPNVEII